MKEDTHIINILESSPFNRLGETELATVRAHVGHCEGCLRAFEAAQISALLLKERAVAEIEPSPFFQTRVLAALREQRAASEASALSFRRLWRATGALVSGMAATVAALAVFTFFAPQLESTQPDTASVYQVYSAEEVILARGGLPEDDLSYDQLLTTIYESDADAER
ncbi:MAG TPA: hypothetical protein VD835_18925 [Pyrinomonadaceae bacterium]|nr:hypothetical protein [Pyrinomonadaceae bacterium]